MDGRVIGRVGVAAAMLLATAAAAETPATLAQYKSLAIAPDGSRVVSIDSAAALDTAVADTHGVVVVRNAASGAVTLRLDPCPACSYAGPAWSPDGRAFAFVAADAKTGAQLMVADAASGAVRTVATVKGLAATPRWSADGRRLAVLAVEGAHKSVGAVEAGRAQVGTIGETEDEQRIAVVDAAGGSLRFVSPADTWVYEYDWTPDGTGFVATAAKGNGDNNWWVAKLVAVDAASVSLRTIAAPAMQMNAPRVSHDGKWVVFIGGLMSDFGSVGGDLYAVPLGGGAPVDLTAYAPSTVTSLTWTGPDAVVTRRAGDRFEIARVGLAADRAAPRATLATLWSAPVSGDAGEGHVSVAADGRTAASVVGDFTHPDEIAVGRVAGDALTPAPITHGNAALTPHVAARSLTWTSEGRTVQGWLLTPLAPAAGKRPMIVQIHGGPSASANPAYVWNGTTRAMLDAGYVVFEPNPRGSYGQGEAFTAANKKDFGGGDLRDILAGVDAVVKEGGVDPNRLGVWGHSYGGFMTMWTVTHSTRFKAAVAGAGIADWISYYGQNGIDQWLIPFFGKSAYDDPQLYLADSPISTIRAARTPTLIYVGERDVECPAAQSVEFWHGLKEVGVPTQLIIYEGAGHRLRKPDQVHDREARLVGWFDRYLK